MDRKHYDLVYQCGIANVFRVTRSHANALPHYVRVAQAAYETCEWFVRGLLEAGAEVSVWHSDIAGDVLSMRDGDAWKEGPGDLWRSKKCPPPLCEYADAQ